MPINIRYFPCKKKTFDTSPSKDDQVFSEMNMFKASIIA